MRTIALLLTLAATANAGTIYDVYDFAGGQTTARVQATGQTQTGSIPYSETVSLGYTGSTQRQRLQAHVPFGPSPANAGGAIASHNRDLLGGHRNRISLRWRHELEAGGKQYASGERLFTTGIDLQSEFRFTTTEATRIEFASSEGYLLNGKPFARWVDEYFPPFSNSPVQDGILPAGDYVVSTTLDWNAGPRSAQAQLILVHPVPEPPAWLMAACLLGGCVPVILMNSLARRPERETTAS